MAIRGAKPKPAALHEQNGTTRKDRQNTNPVKFDPVATDPPEWAYADLVDSPRALEFWNRNAPLLASVKVLTQGDVEALVGLCLRYHEYHVAREIVELEGVTVPNLNGGLSKHPAVTTRDNAWTALMRGLSEFGMTPVGRQRIPAAAPTPGDDPFLTLINPKGKK